MTRFLKIGKDHVFVPNKRCSGPCVGHIKKDYLSTVNDIDFISGKSRRYRRIYQKKWKRLAKN